jgi:phosphoserine phosphatase
MTILRTHVTAHALVFVAADRESYFEAVRMLGRVALARGLPPPSVLASWEAAEWIYGRVDDKLAVEAGAATAGLAVDWALVPVRHRRKRLLVADMDSTIIGCECLDELADYVGLKTKISAITERAMRGELEFEAALRERVALLAGLDVSALERCFEERVRLNAGARTMVRTMAKRGARCVLVSGGFTFFTARVAELAGFHAHFANTLLDDGKALTGKVQEPILGRAAKLATLRREASNLDPDETLAIGDGANDLDMIEAAGLGVAYRAKPVLAAASNAQIVHTSLETVLFFQGYRRDEFALD